MLKPIKTEGQYNEALARAYDLMQEDLKENSDKSDELEVLSILIENYESEHYPIPSPNPLDAIKFRMDQMGMSEKELGEILGYRSRKSEILSGKRKLSLAMIRKLNEVLRIPAEVLIQAY
jgi:HTH-type transcriptional regulator/antitoxin HigA